MVEAMWTNPTVMNDQQLEAELSQVEATLSELEANGGKVGELRARLWRLNAEKAFRKSGREEPMIGNAADLISQVEKRQVLENDRRASTYMAQAASVIDEDRGGRFAAVGSSATVIGTTPVEYPQQPLNSPWASEPIGTEPPLGYSVDEHEAAGELHERGSSTAATSAVEDEGPVAQKLSRTAATGSTSKKLVRRF